MYKTILLITIIVFSVFSGCSSKAKEKGTNKKESNTISEVDKKNVPEIKGLAIITDAEFKRQFIEYLSLIEKRDMIAIYNKYLSKEMKEGVKDAEEYASHPSDLVLTKPEEIYKYSRSTDNVILIRIREIAYEEGNWLEVRETTKFIKELEGWKFDGVETSDFKSEVIENQDRIKELRVKYDYPY